MVRGPTRGEWVKPHTVPPKTPGNAAVCIISGPRVFAWNSESVGSLLFDLPFAVGIVRLFFYIVVLRCIYVFERLDFGCCKHNLITFCLFVCLFHFLTSS